MSDGGNPNPGWLCLIVYCGFHYATPSSVITNPESRAFLQRTAPSLLFTQLHASVIKDINVTTFKTCHVANVMTKFRATVTWYLRYNAPDRLVDYRPEKAANRPPFCPTITTFRYVGRQMLHPICLKISRLPSKPRECGMWKSALLLFKKTVSLSLRWDLK